MFAADPFLFWSLFAVCGAVIVIIGTPLMGAILQVMNDQAILTESPKEYDVAVNGLKRMARPYHAAFLVAVLAPVGAALLSLATGPTPVCLIVAAVSAAAIRLIDRRYGKVEERTSYLRERLDQGRQNLSLVQG